MGINFNTQEEESYWSNRYRTEETGWDIGYPSGPIKAYIDQLTDKELRILIPGAGNAYEAEYLYSKGFSNVFVMDISKIPLDEFAKRVPDFPEDQLLYENFFDHNGSYDIILEQTFFCSFQPSKENRNAYAQKMSELLNSSGKLVGLWFDIPLEANQEKRPFGGRKTDYLNYLTPYFDAITFDKAYNSIDPRKGSELFGIFKKK